MAYVSITVFDRKSFSSQSNFDTDCDTECGTDNVTCLRLNRRNPDTPSSTR
jgi:hypothetical protein